MYYTHLGFSILWALTTWKMSSPDLYKPTKCDEEKNGNKKNVWIVGGGSEEKMKIFGKHVSVGQIVLFASGFVIYTLFSALLFNWCVDLVWECGQGFVLGFNNVRCAQINQEQSNASFEGTNWSLRRVYQVASSLFLILPLCNTPHVYVQSIS